MTDISGYDKTDFLSPTTAVSKNRMIWEKLTDRLVLVREALDNGLMFMPG